MARLSARREQLTEEGRDVGRTSMKREKRTGPRKNLRGTPRRIRKERLMRCACQINIFVVKCGRMNIFPV